MANLEQANEYQHSPNSQLIDLVKAPVRQRRPYEVPTAAGNGVPAAVTEMANTDAGAEMRALNAD